MPDERRPAAGVTPAGQDFYKAFGVGIEGQPIHPVDGVGVSLAAVQGLYELVKQQALQIEELREQVVAAERAAMRPGDGAPAAPASD